MLLDDLKKANIEAMKAKDADKRAILSVVIGKAQLALVESRASGKEFGDTQILEIIQKVVKELDDEREGYIKVNNQARVDSINNQQTFIKTYLPTQLTEEDIRAEIAKLDDKSLPNIMKHFKINFAGRVNMSLVSQIARSL